jgi:two-component system chemotaxis response regulator CheB
MIKVLIVEDSPAAREYLVHIMNSDPSIEVVGTATNGREALEAVARLKPDAVTMDINMPVMDGLEATRRIMEANPVPIVIVSSVWDPKEVETTFKAVEAGALAIVQRPVGIGHPDEQKMAAEMILKVKLMSEVKVVRRWTRDAGLKTWTGGRGIDGRAAIVPSERSDIDVLAIGASTGGPIVLRMILSALPKDFPAPILIVQHIAAGFLSGMVDWLAEVSALPLQVAEDGKDVLPGSVYFAPDGFNLGVGRDRRIRLDKRDSAHEAASSISHLFRSVADAFGGNAVGILLSGMGSDGAAELKLMREKGAVTIAQDRESSIIFGMPGAAVDLGAAMYVLPPEKIVATLRKLTHVRIAE